MSTDDKDKPAEPAAGGHLQDQPKDQPEQKPQPEPRQELEPKPNEAAIRAAADEQAAARATEIAQLCQLASCPTKAAEYIASGKDLAVIRAELLEAAAQDHQLSDRKQEPVAPADAKKRELRAEYDAQAPVYKKLGVTFEEYCESAAATEEQKERGEPTYV